MYKDRGTIIRPTYIAGPGDHTDRFTYWPWRVSKGGEMLAPGTPNDPFQYIDVRDLADFIRTCVEKNVTGKYNLCGPQGAVTMGSLLEESKRITKANTTFVWASPEFLTAQEIIGEKAKGNFMPIWQPPVGDEAGLLLVSPARARKKGLKFRSLETTIRDTLEWQKKRPEDKQVLKAGLTMEKEKELLRKIASGMKLMDIDTSDFQEESKIEGEDPEDTELLREMAAEARAYMEDFEWCPSIESVHLALGVGGVVGVFLFQFDEVIEDDDDALWVVVGDLPSAYVIVEPDDDGISALERYCELMEDWAFNVLKGTRSKIPSPSTQKRRRSTPKCSVRESCSFARRSSSRNS